MAYDIEKIRAKLKDYYGTGMFNASPLAMLDVDRVDLLSDDEVLEEARKCGINVERYNDDYER